ncbi:MAG: tRNA-intron lyase [Candidatus Bathyarchaeia archaeon]
MKIFTVTATLAGDRLIVWEPEEGSKLYKLGFYGKPIGISKPKTPEFNKPLILDLLEGTYLLEKGIIRVLDQSTNLELNVEDVKKYGRIAIDGFDGKYLVYRDLRDKGYVVTIGIKFGSDFAVYRKGPGIDHAPYIVQVKMLDEAISATEIVRSGRLATTVRKRFIVAVPKLAENRVVYLLFNWFKA